MTSHGVRDLAHAMLAARRYQAQPDLTRYHADRYGALLHAFGSPKPGATTNDSMEAGLVADLLDASLEQLLTLRSPFVGLQEAPERVIALHQQSAGPINDSIEATTRAIEELFVQLVAEHFGLAADARVDDADLIAHGFDPSTPRPGAYDDDW